MARRIPRREFLASLGAGGGQDGRFFLVARPGQIPRWAMALAAKPKSDPIFQAKALKGVDFVLRNSPTPRKYLIETCPEA